MDKCGPNKRYLVNVEPNNRLRLRSKVNRNEHMRTRRNLQAKNRQRATKSIKFMMTINSKNTTYLIH